MSEPLVVQSNVARDMLGTADEFGSVPKMVVEYVSNGLDNPEDPSQPVRVTVDVKRYGRDKTVTIADNGCGMDEAALRDFFIMHRENAQRQRGRRARGRFGTGKSAGFGVGTKVLIETRHGGHLWRVELTREELRKASVANRPPEPRVIVDAAATKLANGTTVTISGIDKAAKADSIRNELRRRLGRQLESHQVLVEGQRVRLEEPAAVNEWTFSSEADSEAATLGSGLTCQVKAVSSGASVEEAIRGVIVTSRDVPVAQYEAAGDLAKRIFGVCEVPALDDDTSTPGPFTDRRDLRLNLDNTTAAAVDAWVRRCLEAAISELHSHERDRMRRARDAELQAAAGRAESVLNQHYRNEFRRVGGVGEGSAGTRPETTGGLPVPDEQGEAVVPCPDGVSGYARPERNTGTDLGAEGAPREDEMTDSPDRTAQRTPQPRDPLADGRGDAVTQPTEARRRRNSGGFHIDYDNAGQDAPRAAFHESDLRIILNLDHPLLAAVYRDKDLFQGLAFTIAAEEYAQATANQLLADKVLEDAYEALQYERSTIDSLSRAFSEVFATLAAGAQLAFSE